MNNPDYVLQRGDFFVGGGGGGPRGSYMGFGVDTKIHCYILREGLENKSSRIFTVCLGSGEKSPRNYSEKCKSRYDRGRIVRGHS